MHIVLGLLGSIVTILVLLNRLTDAGIDVGWLNPFAWKRRRDWAKRISANPAYDLTEPMEVTALLLVALAKSEGDISREQKAALLALFRDDFHLDEREAAALFTASSYLLRDGIGAVDDMNRLLEGSRERFSAAQVRSAIVLFERISQLDSAPTEYQRRLVQRFAGSFALDEPSTAAW